MISLCFTLRLFWLLDVSCSSVHSVHRSLFALSVQVWRWLLYRHHLCLWREATMCRPLRWRLLLRLWGTTICGECWYASVSAAYTCVFVISPVNGGRKSVTHSAAATGDDSMLQLGAGRTVGGPQDRNKSTPPQSSSRTETPAAQGQSSGHSSAEITLSCGRAMQNRATHMGQNIYLTAQSFVSGQLSFCEAGWEVFVDTHRQMDALLVVIDGNGSEATLWSWEQRACVLLAIRSLHQPFQCCSTGAFLRTLHFQSCLFTKLQYLAERI